MRVAVVCAASKKKEPPEYARFLAKGMESMGHRADIVDAWTEDGIKLPGYEYIAVVTESTTVFSGKIPEVIARVLAAGSSLVGKKSAAFVKKGIGRNRTLSNLMKAMEKEGMLINWSEILLNNAHAEAIGKRIGA